MRYVPANKAGLTTLHGGWSPPQRRRKQSGGEPGQTPARTAPVPLAHQVELPPLKRKVRGSSPRRRTQERPCHLGAGWCGSTGSNEVARLDGAGSHPPRPGGRSRSVAQLAEPAIDAEMRVRIASDQHMPSKLRWKQRWCEEPEGPGSTPGEGTSARGWSGRHARPRRLQSRCRAHLREECWLQSGGPPEAPDAAPSWTGRSSWQIAWFSARRVRVRAPVGPRTAFAGVAQW